MHPDGEQPDVPQHLQHVDAAQVLHTVPVLQLVLPVYSQLEVLAVTEDDHLHRHEGQYIHSSKITAPKVTPPAVCVCGGGRDHLKILSCRKGKAVQLGLLRAPALRQEGVPDKDASVQMGVQVESNVIVAPPPQVHTKTGKGERILGLSSIENVNTSYL